MHRFEALEQRRMLTGGVDATFGSANGAPFNQMDNTSSVLDSAVDPAGRVMLAGKTGLQQQIFLARIHIDGQVDAKFGTNGVLQGTPRGFDHIDDIVPLPGPDGGYIAAAGSSENGAQVTRLIKLTARGRVDSSFGHNGAVGIVIASSKVLVHDDGTIDVVGVAAPRDPNSTDAESQAYLVKLNADGIYGDTSWTTLADVSLSDQFLGVAFSVTGADLDSQDREVITFAGSSTNFDSTDAITGGEAQIFLMRVLADGKIDRAFGDVDNLNRCVVYDQSWTGANSGTALRNGIAVARRTGAIEVLSAGSGEGFGGGPLTAVRLDSVTAAGVPIPGEQLDLDAALPNFSVHALRQGALVSLSDQATMIAGVASGQSGSSPAVIRLTAFNTVDTTFGAAGVIALSNANGLEEAHDLAMDPDGTVTAVSTSFRNEVDWPADQVQVTRLFPDDRPVASLLHSRETSGSNRLDVTVSIRGTSAINPASLDDTDLHINNGVESAKMRLTNFVQNPDGSITARYHVIPFSGLLNVYVRHASIFDIHGNGNVGGTIAQLIT